MMISQCKSKMKKAKKYKVKHFLLFPGFDRVNDVGKQAEHGFCEEIDYLMSHCKAVVL